MLELKNIIAGYSRENMILKGIDLTINDDEVVAIVGQNGSGKSTIAKSIMGMVPYISGEIIYNENTLTGKTTSQIADMGIGFFMQGGRVFPQLTVEENLDFAGSGLKNNEFVNRKIEIKDYFDLLKNNSRTKLKASYLSGGEQHQLALAMVLMRKPKLIILDEPSAGLSPGNVKSLYDALSVIKQNVVKSIIIVEQNISSAFNFSKKLVLLQEGRITTQANCKRMEIGTLEALFF